MKKLPEKIAVGQLAALRNRDSLEWQCRPWFLSAR